MAQGKSGNERITIIAGSAFSILKHRIELIDDFLSLGCSLCLLVPESDQSDFEELERRGVCVVRMPLNPTAMNPWHDYMTYRYLKKYLVNCKPDIVICLTIKPIIYGSLAAGRSNIKGVYSIVPGIGSAFIRNKLTLKIIFRAVKMLYKRGLAYNQLVIFENEDDRVLFKELGLVNNIKSRVGSAGVNLSHYFPTTYPKKVSFTLMTRLIKDKGVYEYVEAAKVIKRAYPDITFYLAGSLSSNPTAIKISEINLWVEAGVIKYLGDLPDVRPLLKKTSVFVLPSYREGTSRSTLEAMAMARPVITTDTPGCRETVEDGKNGFLVPDKNVSKLVEAMVYFIVNHLQVAVMGQYSRQIVEARYDVNKVNASMIDQILG